LEYAGINLLNPGSQIGSYTIVEFIASGGMAMVFKAQDPRGRLVALKVMLPNWEQNDAMRLRFHRGA